MRNARQQPDWAEAASALSRWFRDAARDLPWRSSYDPYRVWVAEVMLQQTTSAACVPFFLRFVQRFPTVADLAAASEGDVLALWSGLGYYTRGRNLLRAAQTIVREHAGMIPSEIDALRALPGVGDYTAGAVRAIAHNLPAPMVDANVRRVIGRLLGIPPGRKDAEACVHEASGRLSGAGEPRIINQALMELGALLCVPLRPSCQQCPLGGMCAARAASRFEWFGSVRGRAPATPRSEVCVAAMLDGRWLLSRPRDGRWKGMWEFPRSTLVSGETLEAAAGALCRDILSVSPSVLRPLGVVRHRVTRWDISLHVVRARLQMPPVSPRVEWTLVAEEELASLPLPSPMKRVARALAGSQQLDLLEDDP